MRLTEDERIAQLEARVAELQLLVEGLRAEVQQRPPINAWLALYGEACKQSPSLTLKGFAAKYGLNYNSLRTAKSRLRKKAGADAVRGTKGRPAQKAQRRRSPAAELSS